MIGHLRNESLHINNRNGYIQIQIIHGWIISQKRKIIRNQRKLKSTKRQLQRKKIINRREVLKNDWNTRIKIGFIYINR